MITAETILRVFYSILYLLAGLAAWRWLLPRLTPNCKGLALTFFLAQVVVIALSLESPSTTFDKWLWHLDQERNIPSTLAAITLSTTAALALIAAIVGKSQPGWHRMYLIGIAGLFVFLARTEYYALHERAGAGWQQGYIAISAFAVCAITIATVFAGGNYRFWNALLLFGLAVLGLGSFFVEELRYGCVRLPFPVSGCILSYPYEEVLEFLGAWLALLAILGVLSLSTPKDYQKATRLLFLLPPISLALLLLPFAITRIEFEFRAEPARITYASGLRLDRIIMVKDLKRLRLTAYFSAQDWHHFTDMGFSLNIVDQVSLKSVAGINSSIGRNEGWRIALYDEHVRYRPAVELTIPPETPSNLAMWIVLKLWREEDGGFVSQRVLSSDLPLLTDSQVILDELVIPAISDSATGAALATFDNGFALQAADLPACASRAENLELTFTWRGAEPVDEDHSQFLHLGHEDGGQWFVYDQQPLGARLPTRLWYDGLLDSESWQVPLPADLVPGPYAVFTGLYRLRDKERVPVTDAAGTPWLDNRVALGSLLVQNAC